MTGRPGQMLKTRGGAPGTHGDGGETEQAKLVLRFTHGRIAPMPPLLYVRVSYEVSFWKL